MKAAFATLSALAAIALLAAGVFAADEKKDAAPLAPNTYKSNAPVVKCPVTGNPIDKNAAVDFEGGKVWLCCENCPVAFKKDPAKFAAKSHLQMVQTEQLKQVACPFTGNKLDPARSVEVEGVKVGFCCEGCEAKAKKAKPEELVSLVFKDTSKGFKLTKDIKQDEPAKK